MKKLIIIFLFFGLLGFWAVPKGVFAAECDIKEAYFDVPGQSSNIKTLTDGTRRYEMPKTSGLLGTWLQGEGENLVSINIKTSDCKDNEQITVALQHELLSNDVEPLDDELITVKNNSVKIDIYAGETGCTFTPGDWHCLYRLAVKSENGDWYYSDKQYKKTIGAGGLYYICDYLCFDDWKFPPQPYADPPQTIGACTVEAVYIKPAGTKENWYTEKTKPAVELEGQFNGQCLGKKKTFTLFQKVDTPSYLEIDLPELIDKRTVEIKNNLWTILKLKSGETFCQKNRKYNCQYGFKIGDQESKNDLKYICDENGCDNTDSDTIDELLDLLGISAAPKWDKWEFVGFVYPPRLDIISDETKAGYKNINFVFQAQTGGTEQDIFLYYTTNSKFADKGDERPAVEKGDLFTKELENELSLTDSLIEKVNDKENKLYSFDKFSIKITNLQPNTKYYTQAYYKEGAGLRAITDVFSLFTTPKEGMTVSFAQAQVEQYTGEYKLIEPLPGICPEEQLQGTGGCKIDTTTGLGDYLNRIITLIIMIAGVLSVLMLVFGGIEYALPEVSFGGSGSQSKSKAKERMGNALFGLVLALGSYMILNTINPNLVNINLALKTVDLSSETGGGFGGGIAGTEPTVIQTEATEAGKKILEIAKDCKGKVVQVKEGEECTPTHCFGVAEEIYSRAGYGIDGIHHTNDVSLAPGDLLQMFSPGSPTGEHNVIFDHAESNGAWVTWSQSTFGKPLTTKKYTKNDRAGKEGFHFFWKPVSIPESKQSKLTCT